MNRPRRSPKRPARLEAPRPLDVDHVLAAKPTYGVLLRRGFTKRCPRCGAGGLYQGWFRMRERCPSCGYLFEREPGFFVGAYLINFAIAEGFLFVLLMGFILWKSAHPEAGLMLPLVIGFFIGVIGPLLFYPYARTIWSAIDLAMTPLELKEIVAAADAVDVTGAVSEAATEPGAADPPADDAPADDAQGRGPT